MKKLESDQIDTDPKQLPQPSGDYSIESDQPKEPHEIRIAKDFD